MLNGQFGYQDINCQGTAYVEKLEHNLKKRDYIYGYLWLSKGGHEYNESRML